MSLRTFVTLATLGLATAQTSVVSLFIFNADPQPLVGSIIAEGSGTTTYSINCAPGTDSSDCGMGPGMFFTSGPATVEWSMSEPAVDFYGREICSMDGTSSAVCTVMMSGTGANFPGTSTFSLSQSDITFLPVTITAGPSAGASASTTAVFTTTAPTSSSSGSTGSAESTASQTSDTSSATSSTTVTTGSSTGGISQITGNPGLALGGAAIALVAAL